MLTTITIDEYGPKSFRDFKNLMNEIKHDYDKYGDSVLEYHFKKDFEAFSKLFKSNPFEESVYVFWKSRYHFVANTILDLIHILEDEKTLYADDDVHAINLFPESNDYSQGETKGNEQIFSISEELYKFVHEKINFVRDNVHFAYTFYNDHLYELSYGQNPYSNRHSTFDMITIREINSIIKV